MNALIVLVLAICWSRSCQAQQQQQQQQQRAPEIKDRFEKNWYLHTKDKVVHSRTFNRDGDFSFTSCDTANRYCNVSLASTNSSDSYWKTCKFDLDPYESTELAVAALFLPNGLVSRKMVGVEWYRKGAYDHIDSFLNFLDMNECNSGASHFIGSIDETKEPSHVIVYRYPKLKSSAPMRHNRRLIRELTFGQAGQYASKDAATTNKYVRANQSWVGEERAVEFGSSDGFFFIASNDSLDAKVDVMYANLTSDETRVLGNIGVINDPTHTYPKTSGARNKYGLCWTARDSYDRDNRVNCTQFRADGRRSIKQVSLQLPELVDWLAVHNLNDSAMLLVTGQCEGNKCNSFRVTKIHADGRPSPSFDIGNLNAECPERPSNLSLDVVEDDGNREICFNFVCLKNRYGQQYSDKISTTVQYRRNCVDRDYVLRMN